MNLNRDACSLDPTARACDVTDGSCGPGTESPNLPDDLARLKLPSCPGGEGEELGKGGPESKGLGSMEQGSTVPCLPWTILVLKQSPMS